MENLIYPVLLILLFSLAFYFIIRKSKNKEDLGYDSYQEPIKKKVASSFEHGTIIRIVGTTSGHQDLFVCKIVNEQKEYDNDNFVIIDILNFLSKEAIFVGASYIILTHLQDIYICKYIDKRAY
jgi:hypothetical protein